MHTPFVSRPLPLTGALNVRDLGGYATPNGKTASNMFLRGDGLHRLTPEDMAYLADYGVSLVVDLRSQSECERNPDPFQTHDTIRYESVTLLDQMNSKGFQGAMPSSMYEVYVSLLDDSAPSLGKVIQLLAEAKGTALFHCTAGKDRTGVTAMLLLSLAGVSRADIIADYAITQTYIAGLFDGQIQRIKEAGRDVPMHLFQSHPEEMIQTLDYLTEKYGTAEKFLLNHAGCSPQTIAQIKRKLG